MLSSLNASEVGSVSSSKRSPPPEYTNGANPPRVGSIATPLVSRNGRAANFAAVTNWSQLHRRWSAGTSNPRISIRLKSTMFSL